VEPIEIVEEGYVLVKLTGTGGQSVEMPVDLYAANNRLVEIRDTHTDEPEAPGATKFNTDVVAYLAELGFPQCSHYAAHKFAGAIFKRRQELVKKGELPESVSPTPN
jgi:hypothetical protein